LALLLQEYTGRVRERAMGKGKKEVLTIGIIATSKYNDLGVDLKEKQLKAIN